MPGKSKDTPQRAAWGDRDAAYTREDRSGAEPGYESGLKSGLHSDAGAGEADRDPGQSTPEQSEPKAQPIPAGERRPAPDSRLAGESDEHLLEEFSERLSRSGLDVRNAAIAVEQGRVTLSGEVTDEKMKQAVGELAAACCPGRPVDNRLQIRPGATGRSISSYGSDA